MGSKNDRCVITIPVFCPHCGEILPLKKYICNACKNNWALKAFGNLEMTDTTIHFNSKDTDGSIEERSCPQCENEKMSYTTLQLKLVDEGPTIFYTCPKCTYAEAENYYY